MSSYTASWPALTMPMSRPACTAWYRNAACIASRTWSLPRNEKLMFETPPEMWHAGACLLDAPRGLDEVDGVVVVLLDAGGDGEDVGVEDDVLGGEADLLGEQLERPLANADLVVDFDGLALLVERHHHDRRAVVAAEAGAAEEFGLAVFEADRVDDRSCPAPFSGRPRGPTTCWSRSSPARRRRPSRRRSGAETSSSPLRRRAGPRPC